jgi:class 3 adenylate cyclase
MLATSYAMFARVSRRRLGERLSIVRMSASLRAFLGVPVPTGTEGVGGRGLIEYVEHDGALVAYRVQGHGPIDILHLPGWVTSIDVIDEEPHIARFDRRLAGMGRLIDFDLPGVGLSDGSGREFDVEQLSAVALAVLDAVGSEVPVIVAQGAGPVAMHLAATRPERIRALVLVNTTARMIRANDYAIGLPERLIRDYIDESSTPGGEWTVEDLDHYDLMAPSLAGDAHHRAFVDRAMRHGASPAVARQLRRFLTYVDVRDVLAKISAPTLVITRQKDMIAPAAHGRYLAAHIPDAKLVELPGADHLAYSGDADALLDEIEEFLIGRRRGSRDRVLATIMFTDMVDSTAQAAAMHDAEWRAHLDAHDAVVRASVTRFDGQVENSTGDGVCATFELPTQALRCAETIMEAGFAVRIGVHTGECERRHDDLAGLAVHVAARVAAIAKSGEILVSSTVRDLVSGSGLQFVDRGSHELKGVPGQWRLFALNREVEE